MSDNLVPKMPEVVERCVDMAIRSESFSYGLSDNEKTIVWLYRQLLAAYGIGPRSDSSARRAARGRKKAGAVSP